MSSEWNKDRKIKFTVQDPCQLVRKSFGDPVAEDLRFVVKAVVGEENFIEMYPNRSNNYCCGGGGGTVSIDEIRGFRVMVGGETKAEQIKATGAHYVVTPCANCKKQVSEIIDDFELDVVRTGLHDLLLQAIIMPDGQKPEPRRVFA